MTKTDSRTTHLRIGTRSSKLALAQAHMVIKKLTSLKIDFTYEIITKVTCGDKFDIHPTEFSNQGIFTKELDIALTNKEIDIAVHSMKDMPTKSTDGLFICGALKRNTPNEAFISNKFNNLKSIADNSTIGTSSARRKAQILNINPKIKITNLRGNINKRIEQVDNNSIDGTILSLAGLQRIKIAHLAKEIISTNTLLPAPCQGIIAMQCRKNDFKIIKIITKISDEKTMLAASIERDFLKLMGAGCGSPLGGLVKIFENKVIGTFEILSKEGSQKKSFRIKKQPHEAFCIAKEASSELLKKKHFWS